MKKELAKAYEPSIYEDAIYKKWEESGLFNPDICVAQHIAESDAPYFSIVLPPPNVTGTLHMGHAVMLAVQDAMVRYHRMKGERTLWVPGTDHAAIATQAKVEKLIMEKEKKTKYDLGRSEFLKRVEQFAQESHDTIVNQARKMGASLDWSREAYTLDEQRNLAVRTVFKKMYDDGLIYRGYRVINWSVQGQSTISDDEIVHVERPAKLYYFKYSKDFPITIATTRPETKLGDTAVAVNPNDERYKKYIGQEFTVDVGALEPLKVKIIGEDTVDPAFGTGALGVTPAHSAADFEMYQKQKAA
jgi:valyl-tRNA synthetase